MNPPNFKFGTVENENDTNVKEYFYSNIWSVENAPQYQRLAVAPESNQIELIFELSRILPEPFGILYVLVIPRGGNEEGRYQIAQPLSRQEMESFLNDFKDYFEKDARHHIWIASVPTNSMLIYDNHNIIYAYGELEKFQKVIEEKSLIRQDVIIPVPHVHSYNPKYDVEEKGILSEFQWKHFPLAESDY